jgi:hypothetical protein
MRPSIDEVDLRDLKAGCKPGCKEGSADPPSGFNSTGASE